jgi:hypothetical protein
MKKTPLLPVLLLVVLFGLTFSQTHAQSTTGSNPLFETVQSLDTQLFDAYNHCELKHFHPWWSTTWSSITMSPALVLDVRHLWMVSRTISAAK